MHTPNNGALTRLDAELLQWEELVEAKQSIECQLGARKLEIIGADETTRVDYRTWRAKALRALSAYEKQLSRLRATGY